MYAGRPGPCKAVRVLYTVIKPPSGSMHARQTSSIKEKTHREGILLYVDHRGGEASLVVQYVEVPEAASSFAAQKRLDGALWGADARIPAVGLVLLLHRRCYRAAGFCQRIFSKQAVPLNST